MAEQSDVEKIYLLRRNEKELVRLSNQHEFYKYSTQNQLLAPSIVNSGSGLKVLDSGCADGLWLRDLGGQLTGPGVELYGIDVSRALFPSQESCVATGVDLRAHNVVQSFPSEWNWKDSFDVVHQRLLVWGVLVSEWQSVLNNYLEVLKPGGFVQLTEVTWIPREGFPGDRPVLQRMGRLQRWISEKNSMDIDLAYRLEDVLKQAGFDLVESVQYDLKYGSLGPEDWHVRTAEMASEVFVGMADRMNGEPIPGVAATPEDFLDFLKDLRDDILLHGYQPKIRFAVGRKPILPS